MQIHLKKRLLGENQPFELLGAFQIFVHLHQPEGDCPPPGNNCKF
jgi:hypothetical protein